jgi:RNA polymerase sigma-70 factor, ECF subfamily
VDPTGQKTQEPAVDQAERELILRSRAGDAWAFEELARRYDRQLCALALDLVGDPMDAQDVVQEALIRAYRALPRFRLESDFFTWLYRIALNQGLRFRAGRSRRQQRHAAAAAEPGPPVLATPEGNLLAAELRHHVEQAMACLSRQERAAFSLCHRMGLPVAQAAAIMECSEGSIKSYLFRARGKLRQMLRPYVEA